MAQKAAGKAKRTGVTLLELAQRFPDENAARAWFEAIVWPAGKRFCPKCGGENTHECSHAKMAYRCKDCRKYFSVKTCTAMAGSPLPLLKWLYAIYLDTTSLKGVASMKLHRDLGITQKSAWHMQQRIREAFSEQGPRVLMQGPVEVDGQIHTNGVESFWSMLKRAHKGMFHKLSHKHLQRYVNEFCGRHNIREMDTLTQMRFIARKLMGKHLKYQDLIAWLPHRELAIIAPSLHKGRGSAPRSIYPPAQPVLVAASSLQRLPSHIS